MRAEGTVTEVRVLPEETRVYLADECGGAILHLDIAAHAPPVGSRIRVMAWGTATASHLSLILEPGTDIEQLPPATLPREIPYWEAVREGRLTGSRVRSLSRIRRAQDAVGNEYYEVAGHIRLDPQAQAVPLGRVVFHGILEWQEPLPVLRVHYVVPDERSQWSLRDSIANSRPARLAKQAARQLVLALIVRSLPRDRLPVR